MYYFLFFVHAFGSIYDLRLEEFVIFVDILRS